MRSFPCLTRAGAIPATVVCDPAGLPLEITDPLGALTRCERDAFGRPIAITDPTGATTRLEWTVDGHLARRTAPDGTTESWTYDGEGDCTSHIDPMGGVPRFEHTDFDLLTSRTGPDGVRHEFCRDRELRLTEVTNPQGLTWTYEAYAGQAGQAVSATRGLTGSGPADGAITWAREAMRLPAEAVERVDDSDGWLGQAGAGLADAHLDACRAARPIPRNSRAGRSAMRSATSTTA